MKEGKLTCCNYFPLWSISVEGTPPTQTLNTTNRSTSRLQLAYRLKTLRRADLRRSKKDQERHDRRKKEGLCTRCETDNKTLPDKTYCAYCNAKSVWKAIRASAIAGGYEPISSTPEEFANWWKNKWEACAGRCEWCREPFGNRPHTDHDHSTGEPRALLCMKCNWAESFGLKRLKSIVRALDKWQRGIRSTKNNSDPIPSTPRVHRLDVSFRRWAKFIQQPIPGRDKRINAVVKEMRLRCHSEEEVSQCYRLFMIFMEGE